MLGIIGAGPVGLVTALIAHSEGKSFELFEQKSESQWKDPLPQRAIGITLSDRGLKVIRDLGLFEQLRPYLQPIVGRVCLHQNSNEYFDYDTGKIVLYSISRNDLLNILHSAFRSRTQKSIHFSHKLLEIDVKNKMAHFDALEQKQEFRFDRLLATDGSNSVSQKKLLVLNGAQLSRRETPWLFIPLTGRFSTHETTRNRIHVLSHDNYFLVGIPHYDGTISLTLAYLSEMSLIDKNRLLPEVEADLKRHGIVIDLARNGTETLFDHERPFVCNVTTPVNKDIPISLIGDSRHQFIHLLGQGLNLGLEEASLIFKCSEKKFNRLVNYNSLFISKLAIKQVDVFAKEIRSTSYLNLLRLREWLNRRAGMIYKNEYLSITGSRKNLRLFYFRMKAQHFFEMIILLFFAPLMGQPKKIPDLNPYLRTKGSP